MPLPLILGGLALAAFGAKKGLDAKKDFDKAKRINREAKEIYEDASSELEGARNLTNNQLEELGGLKLKSYSYVTEYITSYNRIKNRSIEKKDVNVDYDEKKEFAHLLNSPDMQFQLEEIVHGGISALGAGGLAGLASYGAVGTFATASTGTAIAGLTGVAATNATLAWLGGGALSAGGFGMAGGAAVLGGIVAGPVLALGGMVLSSKAEAAKHDAYTNLSTAELAAEEMKTAQVVTEGIAKRAVELSENIERMTVLFSKSLSEFNSVINKKRWIFFSNTNWDKMSENDRGLISKAEILATTLFNLLEVDLLTKDGTLSDDSQKQIDTTNEFLLKYSNG